MASTRDWASDITAAADQYGIPAPFLAAIVSVESGGDPRAYRAEPQIADASYGLAQLLSSTARALGWRGTDPAELYAPAVNLPLAARYLADLLRQTGGDLAKAASGYNAGLSAKRPGDAKRINDTDPNAPFINQAYSDRVMARMQTFADIGGDDASASSSSSGSSNSSGSSPLFVLVVLAAVAGLALLVTRSVVPKTQRPWQRRQGRAPNSR